MRLRDKWLTEFIEELEALMQTHLELNPPLAGHALSNPSEKPSYTGRNRSRASSSRPSSGCLDRFDQQGLRQVACLGTPVHEVRLHAQQLRQ
jgi:hypothetical protein